MGAGPLHRKSPPQKRRAFRRISPFPQGRVQHAPVKSSLVESAAWLRVQKWLLNRIVSQLPKKTAQGERPWATDAGILADLEMDETPAKF